MPDASAAIIQYIRQLERRISSLERLEGGGGGGTPFPGFGDAEGQPADVAAASADGTSLSASRRDHVHALVDGAGSGLDADLLDGKEATDLLWKDGTQKLGGALDTSGTATALELKQGGETVLLSTRDAGASLTLGQGCVSDNYALIDLVGDSTYSDYGVRLIRGNTGANTSSRLIHRGTGPMSLEATEAADVAIKTNNTTRLTITATGRATFNLPVSIGQTSDPIAKLRPAAAFTLADSATQTISTSAYGFIFIICSSEVSTAMFSSDGTSLEISDPQGCYTATKNTPSSHNLYVESGALILQNKRGGNRGYHVFHLGLAGAA